MENAAFVVDRALLKNSEDWLVTDLGAFENRGSSARVFVISGDEIVESRFSKGTKADKANLRKGEYLVRNVFERHKKHQDFNRTSTIITKWGGDELPLGLIQFTFAANEHAISPHKHPRSGKKFIPTAPSTKAKLLKEATGRKGPTRIYDEVSEEAGGVLDCEQVADLPRDSKQVINARQRAQNKVREDEFASLLELCKEDQALRNLQWTPSPRVVYFTDEQAEDIVRECCRPDSTSILSIDTTFNVGNYYVTTTLYRSGKIVNRKTNKAVYLPGPAMFHTTKSQRDYLYFAHTLLESNYAMERIEFLGGDRDKAQLGFLKPLKGCTFIACKKHVEDDIKRKITDLGLNSIRHELVHDIFGNEYTKEKGIIDSETEDEFLAKVESVCNKWDRIEEGLTGKTPQFSSYFQRNIQDDMKNGMLLPVRRRAGLQNEFFYNNAQESSNFVLKSKIQEKKVVEGTGYRPDLKCTWSEGIAVYRGLVQQSKRDIQRAVLGIGPYDLSPSHRHLAITASTWSAMDKHERARHLSKLGTSVAEETVDVHTEQEPQSGNPIGCFAESGLPEFLKGSWANANKIVQLEGIGSFPNDESRKVVISLTGPLSHTVQVSRKTSKLACLECPRFNECRICAHTLAVAHHLGVLSNYVKSYQVPLDRMVGTTIPSGAGKKDNERKNTRKRKSNPPRNVSQYGDRIDVDSSTESDSASPYEVVFVSNTKATTCYGCKRREGDKPSDPPPPAPYDIFLRHMEHRIYRRRGEIKVRISKHPEQVYYHPLRSCAPLASRDNIPIEVSVRSKLAEATKQILWREFGINI